MDWSALGPVVKRLGFKALQTGLEAGVGQIPIVGSFLAPQVGKMMADALGVEETPEAVLEAVSTSEPGQVAARLQQVDAEASAKWPALAEIARHREETDRLAISSVNQTMQGETNANLAAVIAGKSISVFQSGWRPFAGWLLNALVALIGLAIVYSMFKAIFLGDTKVLEIILASILSLTAFLAIPGSVVGVTAWGRSYEQGKALEASAPAANQGSTTVIQAQPNAPIAGPGLDPVSVAERMVRAATGKRAR